MTERDKRLAEINLQPCTHMEDCIYDVLFVEFGRRGNPECYHSVEWTHDGNHLICTRCGHDGT